jgi:hypothetical protein
MAHRLLIVRSVGVLFMALILMFLAMRVEQWRQARNALPLGKGTITGSQELLAVELTSSGSTIQSDEMPVTTGRGWSMAVAGRLDSLMGHVQRGSAHGRRRRWMRRTCAHVRHFIGRE